MDPRSIRTLDSGASAAARLATGRPRQGGKRLPGGRLPCGTGAGGSADRSDAPRARRSARRAARLPAAVERRGARPTARRVTCGARRGDRALAHVAGLGDRDGGLVLDPGRTRIDRRSRVPPGDGDRPRRRGEIRWSRTCRPPSSRSTERRRLAGEIARERGWLPSRFGRLLVVRDDRTARRRVLAHAATFAGAFPARGWDVRRWIRDPVAVAGGETPVGRSGGHSTGPSTRAGVRTPFSGLLFLPGAPQASARHRVSTRSPGLRVGPRTSSRGDSAAPRAGPAR